jgi:vacuolar protein sorting-associated protein 45
MCCVIDREIVLSTTADEFYRQHMFSNYGDLGAAVKAMLDEYTATRGVHANISSIEDMQRFVEKFPELKAKGLTVGKHVALMGELSNIIESKRTRVLASRESKGSVNTRWISCQWQI